MNEAVSKRLYSVKEAGRYVGKSPWTIRRLIRDGGLREVRQGRRVMLDIVDLEQFVERYKREAPMGTIYRRKKRDPATGLLVETGPHWMKYYGEGRGDTGKHTGRAIGVEAKRLLKEKEGEVATGLYRGPKIERIRSRISLHSSNKTTKSTSERRPGELMST